MAVIKRSIAADLRYEAQKGETTMLVWDKACIDYAEWYRLKRLGIRFITLEKSNSAAQVLGNLPLDRQDSRNEGIVSDQLVGVSLGISLRRIVYVNPEDGKKYTYLTNESNLPAYLLVLMYKLRWDIEKVFYQFKSKMEERKSWASSKAAKKSHAVFECMAHNLMLLLEDEIKQSEGITDELEIEKARGRTSPLSGESGGGKKKSPSFINSIVQRVTD
jgi:hypothetical protein